MRVADKLGFGPKREVVVHEDGTATVTVTPPKLFVPDAKPVTVELTALQYDSYKLWQKGGHLIQDVMSDLPSSEREKLMTGLE